MDSQDFRYFLFPHTVVSTRDIRHLSLYLPHLSMLQVIRPPELPEWAMEQFAAWPVIEGKERTDQINLGLKGYREFANLHGENTLLAAMSHEHIAKDTRESRFLIQSELKGKAARTPDAKQDLLNEASIFLELARDLDEKEMELEGGFTQIESLEEEFRKVLGIASEEEILEAAGTLSPRLMHEGSHRSFMLSKRISSWLRSFSAHPSEDIPVLVAKIPETLEQALEPVRTEYERAGNALKISQYSLVSAPSLGHLDPQTFSTLIQQLRGSGVLQAYWQSLDQVVKAPENLALLEELQKRARVLGTDMDAFCEEHTGHLEQGRVHLSLTYLSDITIKDIWTSLDPEGHRVLGKDSHFLKYPPILICLA